MRQILFVMMTALLFCTACRSVTPVDIRHTLDFSTGTRHIENRLTGEIFKISNPRNASHFRLLLQENGLLQQADGLFKNKTVLRQIFFCTRAKDNNSGWGLEREDFIESAARLARSLDSADERKSAANKLLLLWQNGSELQVFHFYQQMLTKFNRKLEYVSPDPDHPLPPKEIREISNSASGSADNIASLLRQFDENGILTQEVFLESNGNSSGWQFYPAFNEIRQNP